MHGFSADTETETGAAAPEAPRALDRRVVALWRNQILAWTGGLALVLAAGWPVFDFPPLALAAGVAAAAGAAHAALWPGAAYRGWSFHVGAEELRLRHGVWWRVESVVPHSRIQHVDTQQGPLERQAGLASVVVFTAGHAGGALRIPGLELREAERMRDRLAHLGGADDAV